jgi:hypothetical protein
MDDPHWLVSADTARAWLAAPMRGERNAVRWRRALAGDFAELAHLADALEPHADRVPLDEEQLADLRGRASAAGRLAIDAVLADLQLLREHGHAPTFELLRRYERDADPDLPIDVHSFHVDTANVPTETILCTYHGDASEVLPRADALRRVDEPELRARLRRRFGDGDDEAFAAWLLENAFALHYAPQPGAEPFVCGRGELWRLAVDHPGRATAACIHRAPPPRDDAGPRLLLIS